MSLLLAKIGVDFFTYAGLASPDLSGDEEKFLSSNSGLSSKSSMISVMPVMVMMTEV